MIAVIFEVEPKPGQRETYLERAGRLARLVRQIDGFFAIERFESLSQPGKLLSLSFWRDEAAIAAWRALEPHRQAQADGRATMFADYHLRIAPVVRDYGMHDRSQAPQDARARHG